MSRTDTALSWVAVAIGAAIGTAARYGLDLLLPHELDAVPWSTIVVNTLGSFVLGVLAAGAWSVVPPWLRAGLGAGLLGSFTTFSTLMIVAVATAQGGELANGIGSVEPGAFGQAAVVVVGSVFAGILAAFVGILLGRWGLRRGLRRSGRGSAGGAHRDVDAPVLDDEEDA